MESERSKKSRSLGINVKPQRSNPGATRPGLEARTKSAPLVAQRRQSHSSIVKPTDRTRQDPSKTQSAAGPLISKTDGAVEAPLVLNERRASDFSHSSVQSTVAVALKLAVVGHSQVGKSTFIEKALDLQEPILAPTASKQLTIDGHSSRVYLAEVNVEDIGIENERTVTWPKQVQGVLPGPPDAIILLYDAEDNDTVFNFPQLLNTFLNTQLPVVLVASSSDAPSSNSTFVSEFIESARKTNPHVLSTRIAVDSIESYKQCLLTTLSAIRNATLGHDRRRVDAEAPHSDHALTHHSDLVTASQDSAQPVSDRSDSHVDCTSRDTPIVRQIEDDYTGVHDLVYDITAFTMTKKAIPLKLQTTGLSGSSGILQGPQTPASEPDSTPEHQYASGDQTHSAVPQTPESYYHSSMMRPGTAGTTDSRAHHTFLHTDDESPTEVPQSNHIGAENLNVRGEPRTDGSARLSELVDKLLQLPNTKNDTKFVPSFLCLFRAFATPTKLLVEIVNRFLKVEKSDIVQFAKVGELLRYLQVMAQWTATYPGDFAGNTVRELATTFVQNIEKSKVFAHAAKEISNNLMLFVEDEDAVWAVRDTSKPSKSSVDLHHGLGKEDLASVQSDTVRNSNETHETTVDNDSQVTLISSIRPGTASTASSVLKSSVSSSQSASNMAALESAREEAKKLSPRPLVALGKTQWHQFMEIPVEDLAREITRIDWTLFSSIRPRDFVRHVSLSAQQRQRMNVTDNLGLMVQHFDHLAFFVSGMILLRDKPKHRAKALEKFMDLGWKVRRMNNYNSLGAIVAGITGSEIARLQHTIDLVPPETRKQFQRLITLMSTNGSWASYRMAWENSFSERIPYISVLRRDLTLASSANPTFIGSRINWKKFQIMGDMIVGIQRCHEHPYSFSDRTPKTQDITRLILETKIIDASEDSADPRCELHDRSKQVEPQTSSETKKKFEWLRRRALEAT